jgi:hypothetical protein
MPPTFTTITELSRYAGVDAVLAEERTIVTFMPTAVEVDGQVRLVVPGEAYRLP